MKWISLVVLFIVLVFTVSCEGPTGPTGPIGPQGIQGLTGEKGDDGQDFTYWSGKTTLDANGYGFILLPTEAGSETVPPLLDYYMSDGGGGWYSMATDKYYFGHTVVGTIRYQGRWAVVISDGVASREFMVVAAW